MSKKPATAFDTITKLFTGKNPPSWIHKPYNKKTEGTPGNRKISITVNEVVRDVVDEVPYLIEEITGITDLPTQKIFMTRPRDEYNEGRDVSIVVGNIKGEADTHWALVMEGFVPNHEDYNPSMDLKIVEHKDAIEAEVFRIKHKAVLRAAEHVAYTVGDATDLKPEKLKLFREALATTDAGRQILSVWDSVAAGKALDTQTPKARSQKTPGRRI